MYFKDTCKLCAETVVLDKFNRPAASGFTKREVYCDISGVKFTEFYQAKAVGFKPSLCATFRKVDYQGEEFLEYNNTMYRILRYYPVANECYEATCEAFAAGTEEDSSNGSNS